MVRAKVPGLEVVYSNTPNWADVRSSDVVFMIRPCKDDLKPAAQAAKDFGVPLWVDFDDDLLSLPTDNPSYPFFSRPEVQTCVKEFLSAADLVTVSTKALGDRLAQLTLSRIEVVPNALDTVMRRLRTERPTNKIILWRGTNTHDRDVASVAAQIVEASRILHEYTFAFVGADPCPYLCSDHIDPKRVVRVPPQQLMPYFKTLAAMRPEVIIAPLEDSPFNRCKSNIAALEAAFCGAVCVAPNWEEWQQPGVSNYENPSDFLQTVFDLARSPERRKTVSEAGWGFVHMNLMIEDTNRKRLSLMRQLTGELE